MHNGMYKECTRSGTAISGTRFFGSLDFPTRRFARTLKNTRQSKQIKTHPSTTDLQAITTNRLGNFCRLALQEASILMDTPKGHIFSPPRPPKRAEATAFSPSRHEKETSNETPEHPRDRENKDNDDEEDNQGVPPASSDLTSPRVLKYRREYNEEDGFAAEQAQARKYLHHDILRADFRGTATVSSHSDEDDSFSEMSIATADAKPSGERRKPVSSFDLPSATPMVTSPMSVHTQYALTPSRSCPSFSNLQLSSPTILEPLPPTEPTERQIEREVEEHRRLACFLTYGEAPLPQDIKNYKSPTCSQRPEPRRKEKGVYLPFKQVPGWGSEVAVTTVLGMIEVDRQVREGRGAYPKGWRSRELGLYDNKTIEFSIALSTDKIALDAYKLGYEDGSKQPTAHPALTDNKLADAYGVKRGKIRQSLHAVWLSNDHKKAKEAKKNTGRNRRTKKPTVT